MIKAIYFDFFNTLYPYDSERFLQSLSEIYDIFFKKYYKDIKKEDFLDAYYYALEKQMSEVEKTLLEPDLKKRFLDLISFLNIEYKEEKFIELWNIYEDVIVKNTQAPNFLKDFLNSLNMKYKLGIISNVRTTGQVIRPLQRDGLLKYFSIVVTSSDEGIVKPNKDIFQRGVRRLKLRESEVVFVGDQWDADIIGSYNAGLKPIYLLQWLKPVEQKKPGYRKWLNDFSISEEERDIDVPEADHLLNVPDVIREYYGDSE